MTTELVLPGLPGALAVTPTGLAGRLAPVDAVAALAAMGSVTSTSRWVIGDLAWDVIDWDRDRLHDLWRQVAGRLPDDRPSFTAAVEVSWQFRDRGRRHADLSWSHHRVVSIRYRMGDGDADRWLQEAAVHGWSAHRLEERIGADRQATRPQLPGTSSWKQQHRSTVQAIDRAFTEGVHAVLVRRDGSWRPVDDDAAPLDVTGRETT